MKNYKLAQARAQAGLTQQKAANRIGITLVTYQRYEYGVQLPRLDIAVRISDMFNIDVKELFGEFITKNERKKR